MLFKLMAIKQYIIQADKYECKLICQGEKKIEILLSIMKIEMFIIKVIKISDYGIESLMYIMKIEM
jgi:hypothetical protein